MAKRTRIFTGTSGYSYKEWRGAFYPSELHQDEWLSYYASRLPAVEINNTFYRMPRSHVVETWRDSVPDDFRFVIKASRRITHQKRLKDAEEPMGFLLSRAEILGAKLGALLFQLPPNMPINADRLAQLQSLIPADVPTAFEFRHPSWDQEEIRDLLEARGHALVVSHDDNTATRSLRLMPGPLIYLRLRASSYSGSALKRWQEKVQASESEQAFVFFKHEDAGGGARLAEAFLERAAADSPAGPGQAARKKPAGSKARSGPRSAGATTAKRRSRKT